MQDLWWGDDPEESLATLHRWRLDGHVASHRGVRAPILGSRHHPVANRMLPNNLGDSRERALVSDL